MLIPHRVMEVLLLSFCISVVSISIYIFYELCSTYRSLVVVLSPSCLCWLRRYIQFHTVASHGYKPTLVRVRQWNDTFLLNLICRQFCRTKLFSPTQLFDRPSFFSPQRSESCVLLGIRLNSHSCTTEGGTVLANAHRTTSGLWQVYNNQSSQNQTWQNPKQTNNAKFPATTIRKKQRKTSGSPTPFPWTFVLDEAVWLTTMVRLGLCHHDSITILPYLPMILD